MSLSTHNGTSATPRQRLLEAGGEVFAERGLRAATVREICKRAGTNLATVNYYFGGKDKLYSAVLQYSLNEAMEKYPPDFGLSGKATPEKRLRAFVHSFLLRLLEDGRPAWHGKLMAREMAEPSFALDTLVDDVIRPLVERLQSIVEPLAGRRMTRDDLRLYVQSIIGQCVHYGRAKAVITRLYPGQKYDAASIKGLADHITRFSLDALRRL